MNNLTKSIITILNSLKDNISKYKVYCYVGYNSYYIVSVINNIKSCIDIQPKQLSIEATDEGYYIGSKIKLDYPDEISKLEIYKLAAIIYQRCKDYLTFQINMLADGLGDPEDEF